MKNNSKIINSREELIEKLSKVIIYISCVPYAKNAAEDFKVQLDQIKTLLKDSTKAILNPRALSTT